MAQTHTVLSASVRRGRTGRMLGQGTVKRSKMTEARAGGQLLLQRTVNLRVQKVAGISEDKLVHSSIFSRH